MRQTGFSTKVGSTTDTRPGSDVVVVSEPSLGATLRTKGRFYFLCEVVPASRAGEEIAREIADLTRSEYEYDLSAGIETALRKALRDGNRRAAQRLRDQRGRVTLHCACAVVVNNELYAARIGAAQIFLVRRARLFLPGDDDDELADFVHRTTTRRATSLGSDPELLPAVWKQTVSVGDTIILAGPATVTTLGAEALLNAAVTLHPRAAAEHVHNRFVAEAGAGTDVALFIEIAPASTTVPRLAPQPEPFRPADEVVIAETIRSRVDAIWSRRPRVDEAVRVAAAPAASAVTKSLAVGLELMPRRAAPLGRIVRTARDRGARQQRLLTLLAVGLLAIAAVVGTVVVRDYQANRITADYELAIIAAQSDISAAESFIDHKPPDHDRARQRIDSARVHVADAARSTVADRTKITELNRRLETLADRLASVLIDLARFAPGAKPAQLAQTPNGLYAADPGSGRLWRIFGETVTAAAVLEKGKGGVGLPVAVTSIDAALVGIDDQNRVFRAEGNTVRELDPDGRERWKSVTSVASFSGNIYVLDTASGQVWRHEGDGAEFAPAEAYLTQALPPNTARSLAVDGAVWIVTVNGEILRFRRTGISATASREDFTPRWLADPVVPTAIQAIDSQRNIYLLDAPGKRVVQLTRDGREVARFDLPRDLPEPTAFFVSEGQKIAYTIHGSKIGATDLSR
ncbi:MAG TPA: hypothetical protein VF998_02635 [Candidatus Limnocylindria bacterium]